MRGHRDIGVALHADRAGLALLLVMVLFAASLATALSATAAEKGRSGEHGKSESHGNSDSHGKPTDEDDDDEGSNGHGRPDDDGHEDNGNGNGNGNGKAKGKGKGKGPDKNEEPSLPDEDGDDDDDGDGDGDGDQVLGTRLVRTRVTLTWRNGAFRGRVFSRRDRCEAGRTVNVKRRNGTLIGRDTTNRRGRFAVPARKQMGRFKARTGRKVYRVPARDLRVVCLADRSLLRIRAINNN